MKWILAWFQRRRDRQTWSSRKLWQAAYNNRRGESDQNSGHVLIVGQENRLGERRVFIVKECLPPDGQPATNSHLWVDAQAWKFEIRD